jgi:hypothetical protein
MPLPHALRATALSLAVAVAAHALPAAASSASPAPLCATPDAAVHERGFVAIGGIEQWVTITGDACANPVILFLDRAIR